jgi:hypothetical protein
MAPEDPREGLPVPDLDRWLRSPSRRTSHRRPARAEPEALWQAARAVNLRDCRLLGRLIRARLGVTDLTVTFDALFRTPPFVVLDEGPRWVQSGVAGRIWSPRADLRDVPDSEAFTGWREPGTARVLFACWVEAVESGAVICSEVRVGAVDRRAALRVRALEPVIVAFQSLIGVEPLAVAVRRAEGTA